MENKDPKDGSEEDGQVSDSQLSRFANFLRPGKSQKAQDDAPEAPRQKAIEDMSVFSLMTLRGRKFGKKAQKNEFDDYNIKIDAPVRRGYTAVETESSHKGLIVVLVLLLALIAGAGAFWFLTQKSDSGSTQVEEPSLEELLQQ